MSELNNQLIESGVIQEQESLSSYVVGIKLENFQTDINSIKSDATLYQSFLELIKENAPIESGLKLRAIIKRYLDKKKEDVVEKKEDVVEKKEDVDIIERRKTINIAARENTQAIDNINTSLAPELKGRLDGEVEKQLQNIQSGQPSDATNGFLKSVGINSPADIQSPENQAILRARISTEVYLEEARKNTEFRTQFGKEIGILERNAPTLGIEQSAQAKSVERLLTDMPRDTTGQVVDTVTTLTKSNPDTIVTRTGDTLRFTDPQDEKYSYEIDLGKQPPRLAKSLNGLSISRELDSASPEEQEKQNKKTQTEKLLRDTTEKRNSTLEKHWLSRREEYGLKGEKGDNLYSVLVGENRNASTQYEQLEAGYAQGKIPPKDRADTISRMLTLTESMKIAHKGRYTIDSDNNDRERIEDMLEGRIQNLRNLRIQEENLARIDKTPLEYKKGVNTDEVWGQEAEKSLTFLSELGFPILGQDTMEEFFEAWNLQNKNSVNYQVKLGEQPIIDDIVQKQLRGYMTGKFGEIGGKRNKDLTQLRENLRNDNFNQNNWNRIEKRQSYLFDTRDGETAAENTSTLGEVSPTLA